MKLILQNVTLGLYPRLFTAEAYKDSAPRYSANFVIEEGSEQDKRVKDTILAAMKEAHGEKAAKVLPTVQGQATKYCYLDAALKSSFDGVNGMILSTTRGEAKGKPATVDRAKSEVTEKQGLFYPGCVVNAVVDIWVQQGDFPGVRCALNAVQFVKDGAPLSKDVASADDLPELGDDSLDDLA